jgi:hypothetical protein
MVFLVVVFVGNWIDGKSASPSRAPNAPPRVAPDPVDSGRQDLPPVGTDNRLSVSQIRWCVYEKARLEKTEQLAGTLDLTQDTANRLNQYVRDYNSRCGSFRYRSGDLERVQAELPLVGPILDTEVSGRITQF